ncbi:MAG: hypothetical protein DYG89_16395 [Caldilinea sp. CFX5]|nr:hypothetical protein [Caldilinea sp. CFX5]
MEENKQQTQSTPGDTNTTGQQSASGQRKAQATQELMDDLNRLGLKFAEVVQTAWESEERKRLEKDVKAGVVSLVNGLERGLRKLSETDQAKEFINKAEDVADSLGERIRTSPGSHELASGLAKGLRVLSEQLDKLAGELQRKSAESAQSTPKPPPATPSDSQDIPITKV